jgi:murein DD-endopeptidase MepM/ murein hydrolase activator NlpD
VSNPGVVDTSGRVATFTPYITVRNVTLARNPTQGACLSSGFGWRDLNATGGTSGGRPHNGADFARPSGALIYAAGAGRVVSAGPLGEFGNAVEIDHGSGVHTLYAHLSEIAPSVVVNAIVPGGAVIGRMGQTGNATGVHLHFQIMLNSEAIDPLGPGDGSSNGPTPASAPIASLTGDLRG